MRVSEVRASRRGQLSLSCMYLNDELFYACHGRSRGATVTRRRKLSGATLQAKAVCEL